MNRFYVIEEEKKNIPNMIQNPVSDPHLLADYYQKALTAAADQETETIYFEEIPFAEKKSSNFQNILILERCIMDFLRNHEYPKQVCMVCGSRETAELYKVVYNFYYSSSKEDRLEDDRWD